MKANLNSRWDELEFEWMASHICLTPYGCSYIHQGSCLVEFLRKMATVCKLGLRYYVLFHLIPYILRIKKAKDNKKRLSITLKMLSDYFKSILFMGSLVSVTKGALCLNSSLLRPFDSKLFYCSSFLSGASILWEERSRRNQIGYFIMAKALRSIYIALKRKTIFSFKNEQVWMHMMGMSLLYYVYNHMPQILKFRDTFQMIFGKD